MNNLSDDEDFNTSRAGEITEIANNTQQPQVVTKYTTPTTKTLQPLDLKPLISPLNKMKKVDSESILDQMKEVNIDLDSNKKLLSFEGEHEAQNDHNCIVQPGNEEFEIPEHEIGHHGNAQLQVEKVMDQNDMESTLLSIKKCLANREQSGLDTNMKFQINESNSERILTTRSAMQNKLSYLQNFVTKVEVPSLYVMDAKINLKFQQYSIQLIKYVFPEENHHDEIEGYNITGENKQILVNHLLDGSVNMVKMNQSGMFLNYHNHICLRGLKREGCQLQQQMNIILHDVKDANIEFSDDGTYLALFTKDFANNSTLRVFNIKKHESMQNLFDMIEQNNFVQKFSDPELIFIKKLQFDPNNSHIIGYGDTKIWIQKLEQQEKSHDIYKIDENLYERILDLSFSSEDSDSYDQHKCFIACSRENLNQISIFDICQENSEVINFYYENELTDHLIVKISKDFKSFVFTDIKEKFMIEIQDGYYSQVNLPHLKGKIVRGIEIARNGESGFYFIVSKEYSKTLQLYHSHQEKYLVKFDRDVQPGIITIHDMKIQFLKNDNGFISKTIRIQGMRDDEFVFDKAVFEEKEIQQKDEPERGMRKFERRNIQINEYLFASFTAFSVNWPFITFSGFGNNLIVINAFEKQLYHRVQIAQASVNTVKILKTYITDTYDLFLITQTEEQENLELISKASPTMGKTKMWGKLNKNIGKNFDHMQEQQDSIPAVYKLYHIDLEPLQKRNCCWTESILKLGEPIFQYSEDDVNNEVLLNIHVRGSSVKDRYQDRNQKLVVFFQHQNNIYSWIQKNQRSFSEKILKVSSATSRQMYPFSDQSFVFLRDIYCEGQRGHKKVIIAQEIIKIEIGFSSYEVFTIVRDQALEDKVKTINVDQTNGYLMIFSKQISIGEESGVKIYRFKIYDINKKQILYKSEVKNELLVGILRSGLYTFVHGHIYYNNNTIKIRYDLFEESKNKNFKENEIFDYYLDIIPLKKGMKMRSDTPLDSIKQHRLIYVNQDTSKSHPQIIVMFPYLHDRKIYLNPKRINHEYFYTSAVTSIADEKQYYHKVAATNHTRQNPLRKSSAQDLLNRKSINLDKLDDQSSEFTSIITIDITDSLQYVHSQSGLLINSFDYSKLTVKYGKPVATSSDGQSFAFIKSYSALVNQNGSMEQDLILSEVMKVNVIKMSVFGLAFIKSVDVRGLILNESDNIIERQHWLSTLKLQDIIDNKLKIKVFINDHMDICARIKFQAEIGLDEKLNALTKMKYQISMKSSLKDQGNDSFWDKENHDIRYTYYYFQRGHQNINQEDMSNPLICKSLIQDINSQKKEDEAKKKQMSFVFVTKNHKNIDFCMNKEYLFFYSKKSTAYYSIDKPIKWQNRVKFGYQISKEDKYTTIERIIVNNDPNIILIVLNQQYKINAVLAWDFRKSNISRELWNLDLDHRVLFDRFGRPNIHNNKCLAMMYMRANFMTYDYLNCNQECVDHQNQEAEFGINRGHKFDGLNHNWLIIGDFLTLPFSYMSFVIKDKIENEDEAQKGNVFDPEPYNYIYNKGTCFTDGMFVCNDHEQLQRVLENFAKKDERLCHQLLYKQIIKPKQETNQLFQSLRKSLQSSLGQKPVEKLTSDNLCSHDSKDKYDDVDNNSFIYNTCLHLALESGNNRSIEIILMYLSKIQYEATTNFMSIIDKLILYKNFKLYLENMSFQTPAMQKKQIMRVDKQYNEQIISMTVHNSAITDSTFFKEKMHEKENAMSFPAKIIGVRFEWMIKEPEGQDFLNAILDSEDMELYKIQTLKCIIEFLYSKYKSVLLWILLPTFTYQVIIFHIMVFLFEKETSYCILHQHDDTDLQNSLRQLRKGASGGNEVEEQDLAYGYKLDTQEDIDRHEGYKISLIIFCILNLIPLFLLTKNRVQQIVHFLNQGRSWGQILKWFHFWLDLIYLIVNIILSYNQVHRLLSEEDGVEFYENEVKVIRYLEVWATVLIYIKTAYFFSLVDKLAPLMDIIKKILVDITYFIFIMIFFIIGFSTCYYLIGLNQIEFDEITDDEMTKYGVPYSTWYGSIWYVFDNFVLGNTNVYPYNLGEKSQNWILFTVQIVGSCLMLIHLLNMLIAIMGNTFAERSLVAEEIKLKDHLVFVMDNWHLLNYAFSDMNNARFIIAAFYNNMEHDQDQEILEAQKELKEDNKILKAMMIQMQQELNKSSEENRYLITSQMSSQRKKEES